MRYLVTGAQIPISQYPPHHLLHQPTPKTAIASSLIFLGFSLRPSLEKPWAYIVCFFWVSLCQIRMLTLISLCILCPKLVSCC
jgi:hypothetical protein